MTGATVGPAVQEPADVRFLSESECHTVVAQVVGFAHNGGTTDVGIESSWTGNVHWGRSEIDTSGDVQTNMLVIRRQIRGAAEAVQANSVAPVALEAAVRRAERLLLLYDENPDAALAAAVSYTEPYQVPPLWFDRTYQLNADARAEAMRQMVQPVRAAGLLSAGYLEVAAHGRSLINTSGRSLYHPFTIAQVSLTVRDPKGTGSGWVGIDWNDWGRIDVEHLAAIAVEKCLKSRNPVAIEPGRYTTILEPQATCDFVKVVFSREGMSRNAAENRESPFSGASPGTTQIEEQVIDQRLTLSTDPMDPELAFLPVEFTEEAEAIVYHPVTWIKQGVLKQLAYRRSYAIEVLGANIALPMQGAFHLSGSATSVEEMITTTDRGLLVTRFVNVKVLNGMTSLTQGVTRDGLWLIERGRITKAVRNLQFQESVLSALNRVEQLGPPQRVFRPGFPTVVPPIKVRDFNFSSLVEAI